jgi:hypothetical protein
MTDKNLPSIEYLHKRLRYEPETGKLFWRDCEEMPACWRARWPGREAFANINRDGYWKGNIDDRSFTAHRVIWAIYNGSWPVGAIDHIDGDRQNNRITNLRDATHVQNSRNRALMATNTSGVCGVDWYKPCKKWRARVYSEGRYIYLGLFDTIDAASSARAEASRQYGFTDRHGT